MRMSSLDGGCEEAFPTLLHLRQNETIEIRHESWGCFHHYEDVFEFSGPAPRDVHVYRRHPSGPASDLDIVEERGTAALTKTDIERANRFIAHYLTVKAGNQAPTARMVSTTDDTLRLLWYRDGEIVSEVRVQGDAESCPLLSELLSRPEIK